MRGTVPSHLHDRLLFRLKLAEIRWEEKPRQDELDQNGCKVSPPDGVRTQSGGEQFKLAIVFTGREGTLV